MPHEVYCIQPSLAPIVSSVVVKSTFYILTLAWAFNCVSCVGNIPTISQWTQAKWRIIRSLI